MLIFLLNISLFFITCGPGKHVYSQYGHSAIQLVDPTFNIDVCFNYGFFSFHTKHFYADFIKGNTYYELLIEPTEDFYIDCQIEQREIIKQEINLPEQKKIQLVHALLENAQPENKTYLYNFVFDNCATRPYQMLKKILNDSLTSSYVPPKKQTFRQLLQYYNRKGSWVDLGINLIFGYKADKIITPEQRLFLPEELMRFLNQATFNNTPLLKQHDIHPFNVKPTPWYSTWYPYLAIYILALFFLTIYDKRKKKLTLSFDISIATLFSCLLLLVTYLTFFSLHPLVGFSWRLLIFPLIHICTRSIYLF